MKTLGTLTPYESAATPKIHPFAGTQLLGEGILLGFEVCG